MSNFRKSILIVTVIAMINFLAGVERPLLAQNEPNAPAPKAKMEKGRKGEHRIRGAKQRMQELCDKLNLTEEQKKKIHPVIEKEAKDIQAIHSDGSLTAEQKLEKVKAVKQSTREEINKILTPEQQCKLTDIKSDAKHRAGENMNERMQRRVENMSERLDLTDEQKKQIEPILEKEMNDMSSVRNDESLSMEQKAEKIKEINKVSREEINKILTPEQQAKMNEMKQKARERRMTRQHQESQQEK